MKEEAAHLESHNRRRSCSCDGIANKDVLSQRGFPKDRRMGRGRIDQLARQSRQERTFQTGRNRRQQRPCPRGCEMVSVAIEEAQDGSSKPRKY